VAPRKDDKQFDTTAVLDQAMELFWEKGYQATGMAELVDRMGIGRQSVYDTFGCKRELYLTALRRYVDTEQGPIYEALNGPGKPLERVTRVIRMWERAALEPDHRGCMLFNGCNEMGPQDPEVAEIVRGRMDELEGAICGVLEEAATAGDLGDRFSPRELSRTLVALGHGLLSLGKVSPSKAQVRDIAGTAIGLLTA
jgi:TetR/AcrR family transcriptional repressor of nem operon